MYIKDFTDRRDGLVLHSSLKTNEMIFLYRKLFSVPGRSFFLYRSNSQSDSDYQVTSSVLQSDYNNYRKYCIFFPGSVIVHGTMASTSTVLSILWVFL